MKRKIAFIIFILIIFPYQSYASSLDEIPPYIYFDGANKNNYIVSKTITDRDVIVELKGKKTNLKYAWIFDKNSINESIKLNLDIDFDEKMDFVVENATKNMNKLYLSFAYHGKLPNTSRIKVDVSNSFNNGSNLYLYYYNEEENKIEFVSKDIKVTDGYAEFGIKHCSKYILTNAIVNDAENNPKILSYVIIVLIGFVIFLMAYTLFRK